MKINTVKQIDLSDWNKLVRDTYGRPYDFQQQDGCQSRGIYHLTIPSQNDGDDDMHEIIPEVINGETMGVKFKTWLERDPETPIENQSALYELNLFWERNFYPSIECVANDLFKKGLIDAGDYQINIDW